MFFIWASDRWKHLRRRNGHLLPKMWEIKLTMKDESLNAFDAVRAIITLQKAFDTGVIKENPNQRIIPISLLVQVRDKL